VFEKTYQFLSLLRKNNNREWYQANKSMYNEAKTEFEHITEILIHEVSQFDKQIGGLRPKDCIFRIFRDIRFSTDKTPYKTNFGTYLVPGGRKFNHAGYYLHIEPGESFVATGIYMPPSPVLTAIRKDIYNNHEEFKEILASEEIKEFFGELSGDKLKSPPRGFPKDFENIELLKFKSYGLIRMLEDRMLRNENPIPEIVTSFRISFPFVRFLNEAVDQMEK
jgi:uncharacterized protein (TIGR02453 family)